MYSRFITLLTCRARFSRLLALGLLAAGAAQASALSMPQRLFGHLAPTASFRPSSRIADHDGYLTQVGAPPLIFAPPPPEPVERPAPAEVKPIPEPAHVSTEPLASTAPVATPSTAKSESPVNVGPAPVSILPDDTPRDVRAEDVLPYFQLPRQGDRSSAGGNNPPFTPALPAGATLPPSSATYQLK